MTNIVIETGFENLEEARNLGKTLIYEHLVSCVHISEIESIYMWENDYPDVKEYLVSLKTTLDMYSLVEKRIKELHSYKLPEITYYLFDGSKEYKDWIDKNLQNKEIIT